MFQFMNGLQYLLTKIVNCNPIIIEFKCDSWQELVSVNTKYKISCSGQYRRNFCMNCTGMDKSKVCDSDTLKYILDKVSEQHNS